MTEHNAELEGPVLLEKELIAPKVIRYVIRAPLVARRRRPGQFVIVRLHEGGERIPLTIADADTEKGTISLVVQEVGKSTAEMAHLLKPGDPILDVVGPLGTPTHIERFGRVLAVGGGIGIAPLHPIVQGLVRAENQVIVILGARSKDLMIMEAEMRRAAPEVRIYTDDGSYGKKGLVTDAIRDEVEARGKPDLCIAVGPLIMMRFVSDLTRELGIRTLVSLNPIMVDGTGMCGGCRITVGNETKFVCVDGPEFDAHGVDFEELGRRQRFYRPEEKLSYDAFLKEHNHAPEHCRIRFPRGPVA
jgi:ferredoxin--NADP+ reductase